MSEPVLSEAQYHAQQLEIVGLTRERDELRAEFERMREAAWIFRTYGLPPVDVSRRAEWNRGLLLLVGTDTAAREVGDE